MSRLLGRIDHTRIASGAFPDMKQQSAPVWETVQNVIFKDGKVRPYPGRTALVTVTANPVVTGLDVVPPEVLGDVGLIIGSKASLWSWTSGAGLGAVGSGYTSNDDQSSTHSATRWSLEQWGSWVLATNGKDAPQIFKGSSFTALGGLYNFATAEIFVRWRTFMLAFNLDTGPNQFRWCSDDDVETWQSLPANSAGANLVRDVEKDIRWAGYLGDHVVFFSINSMHSVNWVQAPNYFGSTRLLSGIGAFGKNSVTAIGNRLFGVGPRGIWSTDGTTYNYIDTPAIRQYFLRNCDLTQTSKICMAYDQGIDHLTIWFPNVSGNTKENELGLAFNMKEGQWAPLSYGRTATHDGDLFGAAISAGGGVIYESAEASAFGDGVAQLITKFSDLGEYVRPDDPADSEEAYTNDKLIDAVRLEIGEVDLTSFSIYIGTKGWLKDSPTWTGPFTVDDLDTVIKTRPPEARFVALKIVDSAPAEVWELTAIEIYGEILGGRD